MPLNRTTPRGSAIVASIILAAILEAAAIYLFCASSLAQEAGNVASRDEVIEIKADLVERDTQKGTAVFRGNASATNGGINLTSKEIYVAYNTGKIMQIEARGSVHVSLPHGNEAKSELATLDVREQQLTLRGEVFLSQGENVIRGTELTIDLATGVSKFRNAFRERFGERHQRFMPRSEHMKHENK